MANLPGLQLKLSCKCIHVCVSTIRGIHWRHFNTPRGWFHNSWAKADFEKLFGAYNFGAGKRSQMDREKCVTFNFYEIDPQWPNWKGMENCKIWGPFKSFDKDKFKNFLRKFRKKCKKYIYFREPWYNYGAFTYDVIEVGLMYQSLFQHPQYTLQLLPWGRLFEHWAGRKIHIHFWH